MLGSMLVSVDVSIERFPMLDSMLIRVWLHSRIGHADRDH
jgi:hypothetical protein